MSKVRTRFAPSPTGRMHVGNLRTALYAYLVAKHEGGDFILRIEDTDQERYVEGAVDIIYRTLQKTGLIHDEGPDKDGGCGPYVQSERQAQGIYLKYAKELIDKGEAYYCFCDKERLEGLKKVVAGKEIHVYDKHCLHLSKEEVEEKLAAGVPYVIRQNNPTEGTTTFEDEIYGDITVDNAELDDMILIKSDGYPTYNFANVVDDHLMGITHVVRGNEYLSSSPKYNRLYEAFGWEVPVYIHCPLITDENHQKLSKRCGHSSFEDLVEQGFLTEAIVNFVALLGWSPADNQEIMTLEELVEKFDYHHMNKSPAVFDYTKLKWMNGEYIKKMDFDKFYEMALPYLRDIAERKSFLGLEKTRYVDDKKITDHYAIIPTGQGLGALASLKPLSAKMYEVIVRRFLCIFYPPAVYQKMNVSLMMENPSEETIYVENFVTTAKVLVEEGFLPVSQYSFAKKKKEENPENEEETDSAALEKILPSLKKGMKLSLHCLLYTSDAADE